MNHRSRTDATSTTPHTMTSTHVSAASLRALSAAGFSPLGVVFGNASVHLARLVTLGTKSRLTGVVRGLGPESPESIPSSIIAAQGRAASGPGPAPVIASFPCPHGQGRVVRQTSSHYPGFNF